METKEQQTIGTQKVHYLGYDLKNPTFYTPPANHKRKPSSVTIYRERVEQAYHDNSILPSLQKVTSRGKIRSGKPVKHRREGMVRDLTLHGAILDSYNLDSGDFGFPKGDGTVHYHRLSHYRKKAVDVWNSEDGKPHDRRGYRALEGPVIEIYYQLDKGVPGSEKDPLVLRPREEFFKETKLINHHKKERQLASEGKHRAYRDKNRADKREHKKEKLKSVKEQLAEQDAKTAEHAKRADEHNAIIKQQQELENQEFRQKAPLAQQKLAKLKKGLRGNKDPP